MAIKTWPKDVAAKAYSLIKFFMTDTGDERTIGKISKDELKLGLIIDGIELDPVKGGASSAAATILEAGPAGQVRKREASPGWYSVGGQPVQAASGKRWMWVWNKTSWSLFDAGDLPVVPAAKNIGAGVTTAVSGEGVQEKVLDAYILKSTPYVTLPIKSGEVYVSTTGVPATSGWGSRSEKRTVNGGELLDFKSSDGAAIIGIRVIWWKKDGTFGGSSSVTTASTYQLPIDAGSFAFNAALSTNTQGMTIYPLATLQGIRVYSTFSFSRIAENEAKLANVESVAQQAQTSVLSINKDIADIRGESNIDSVSINVMRINSTTGELISSGYFGHYYVMIPEGSKSILAQFSNYGGDVGCAFYGPTGEYISGRAYTGGLAGQWHELEIPDGAAMFGNSIWNGTTSTPAQYHFVFDYVLFRSGTGLSELDKKLVELHNEVQPFSEDRVVYTTETFDKTDLEVGYYNLSVSPVPIAKSNNTGFKTMRFPVVKGMRISPATQGGNNARAYGITDNDLNLLVVAPVNTDTRPSPPELIIQQDGWFYVNTQLAGEDTFSLIKKTSAIAYTEEKFNELKKEVEDVSGTISTYSNNPYPIANASLRILAIGNSFTNDGSAYIGGFINASGIDTSKLCVYNCTIGGSSLQTWVNAYNNDESLNLSRVGGALVMPVLAGTLKQLLAQNWDVIVIQQLSNYSNDFNSFTPNLETLIKAFRRHCTNQKVSFAWQSVWSYTQAYNPESYGVERWKEICNASIQQSLKIGIDVIIPSGTAIQNARTVIDNNGFDMTRDGYHLAYGVGRYTAAATWFLKLISPVFNVGILGNTYRYTVTPAEQQESAGSMSVDESNYMILQRSAFLAVMDMWKINNPS